MATALQDTLSASPVWESPYGLLTPLSRPGQLGARLRGLMPPEAPDRLDWQMALRQIYQESQAILDVQDRCALAQFVADIQDWPLLIELHRAMPGTVDALAAAQAFFRLGYTDEALQILRALLLLQPDNRDAREVYAQVRHWQEYLQQYPFSHSVYASERGLWLTLLGEQHLEDFAWQYYDPQIARLCCLPEFEDNRQWYSWLENSRAHGDQLIFGVIHPQWGFIGSVSLVIRDGMGFFYYWIGRDFQSYGFGPEAVHLMLRMADECWGLQVCYAKVFIDNHPSRRALNKLGFELLDVDLQPPHDDECLYRLGQRVDDEVIQQEIYHLVEKIGMDLPILINASATGRDFPGVGR